MEEKLHTLTLAERKKCCVTAVAEVDGTSEERITLSLVGGERMVISGKNLKIANFSKQTGAFALDGEIFSIEYRGEKVPLIKKIFK